MYVLHFVTCKKSHVFCDPSTQYSLMNKEDAFIKLQINQY